MLFLLESSTFVIHPLNEFNEYRLSEICSPTRLLQDILHLHDYLFRRFCAPTCLFAPTRLLETIE